MPRARWLPTRGCWNDYRLIGKSNWLSGPKGVLSYLWKWLPTQYRLLSMRDFERLRPHYSKLGRTTKNQSYATKPVFLFYVLVSSCCLCISHKVNAFPDDDESKKSATGWNTTFSIRRWWARVSVHSGVVKVSDSPHSGMLHNLIYFDTRWSLIQG